MKKNRLLRIFVLPPWVGASILKRGWMLYCSLTRRRFRPMWNKPRNRKSNRREDIVWHGAHPRRWCCVILHQSSLRLQANPTRNFFVTVVYPNTIPTMGSSPNGVHPAPISIQKTRPLDRIGPAPPSPWATDLVSQHIEKSPAMLIRLHYASPPVG